MKGALRGIPRRAAERAERAETKKSLDVIGAHRVPGTDMSVPGRRTHLPSDERRDQILDCALEAFARKGFHDTSIADICARAQIGRGTLYQYFKDKRDVLAALIDRIVGGIINAIQHWPQLELPPGTVWTAADNVAFVEGRCNQIMEVVFADADTASLVLRMARSTGFVRDTLARIDQHVVGAIEADIRAGMEQGALRPSIETQVVAQFIVGGIEKLVVTALDEGRALDIARMGREIAELLSSGLLRPDRPLPE
jgi:TetR/AcrR family fatty acid metabolism transcriptional regulator